MQKKLSHKELGELVEKAKRGDTKAFEEIYLNTVSIQFYTALKHTHDKNLAEDVIQELYLKLYSFLDKIENPNLLIAYLNKMNYTISMDLLKESKKIILVDIQEMENDLIDPNSYFKQDFDNEDIVSVALNQLDTKYKEVIMMRYVDKMKIKDIAAYLKISKRTVSRLIVTAVKNLKMECDKIRKSTNSFIFMLSPFAPRILGKIAENCVSEKQIIQIYENIVPSTTQHVDYVSKVAKRFAGSLNHVDPKNLFIKRIGFSAATTIIVGISSLLLVVPNFEINLINKINQDANYQIIEINPSLGAVIKEIRVIQDGKKLVYENSLDAGEQITLYQNGNYEIEAVGLYGNIESRSLVITDIDDKSPVIEIVSYVDGVLEIDIYDEKSDIDLNRIQLYDFSKNKVSCEITYLDSKHIIISIALKEPLIIEVNDMANNKSEGKISLNSFKSN